MCKNNRVNHLKRFTTQRGIKWLEKDAKKQFREGVEDENARDSKTKLQATWGLKCKAIGTKLPCF